MVSRTDNRDPLSTASFGSLALFCGDAVSSGGPAATSSRRTGQNLSSGCCDSGQTFSLVTWLMAMPAANRSFQCIGAQQHPVRISPVGRAGSSETPRREVIADHVPLVDAEVGRVVEADLQIRSRVEPVEACDLARFCAGMPLVRRAARVEDKRVIVVGHLRIRRVVPGPETRAARAVRVREAHRRSRPVVAVLRPRSGV